MSEFKTLLNTINSKLDEIKEESNSNKYLTKRGNSQTLIHLLKPFVSETGEKCRTDTSMLRAVAVHYIPDLKEKELSNVLEKLFHIEKTLVTNLNTLKMKVSSMRKWGENNLNGEELETLHSVYRMTDEDKEKIAEFQTKAMEKENKRQTIVKRKNYDALFNSVKNSNKVIDLITTIMICTGRRYVETLTSSFSLIKGKNKHIMFGNPAKQISKTKVYKPFEIPILFLSSKEIIKKIEELQTQVKNNVDTMTKRQLSSRYDNSVNLLVKKYLGSSCSSHTLRKIYAIVCYDTFKNDSSFNSYIKDILGHEGINTSLNYTTVRLVD